MLNPINTNSVNSDPLKSNQSSGDQFNITTYINSLIAQMQMFPPVGGGAAYQSQVNFIGNMIKQVQEEHPGLAQPVPLGVLIAYSNLQNDLSESSPNLSAVTADLQTLESNDCFSSKIVKDTALSVLDQMLQGIKSGSMSPADLLGLANGMNNFGDFNGPVLKMSTYLNDHLFGGFDPNEATSLIQQVMQEVQRSGS